jgi:hypothetical protein
MKTHRLLVAAALLVLACSGRAAGQQILLDKQVRAGELVLFPDLNDEKSYYYALDKPRLATDANGRPQFSFLRYVRNVRGTDGGAAPREADGGGLVHALVALSVTQEQLRAARDELRRLVPGAQIKGPAMFESGQFALVSSFKKDGKLTAEVVGTGPAPLLDGEKAAVSVQLDKDASQVLWESFQTAAPDISFSFSMQLPGYVSPQRGTVEANFDQIYQHRMFNAGLASTYVGADIRAAFEDLTRAGAIKVTQVGDNAKIEASLDALYSKLTEMMFSAASESHDATAAGSLAGTATDEQGSSAYDKAVANLATARAAANTANDKIRADNDRRREANQAEEQAKAARAAADKAKGTADAASLDAAATAAEEHARTARAAAPAGRDLQKEERVPSFSIFARYEMKRTRQRGIYRVDLNKYTTSTLALRFDENIGDVRKFLKHGDHFRQVNLDDPLYRQREVAVFVDGLNAQDFGQYVNFATVQLRKRHGGAPDTFDDLRIDRNNFNKEGNHFTLLYGWNNDTKPQDWLEYEYREVWSFFGGQKTETDWQRTSDSALSLTPPLQRYFVDVQGTADKLAQAGVRAVTVRVFYSLAGVERSKTVTLNASTDHLSEKVEFMGLNGHGDYAYEIVWQFANNRTVTSGRRPASTAVLFVDDVPAS